MPPARKATPWATPSSGPAATAHPQGGRMSAAGSAPSQGVREPIGAPVDVDPREMPARSVRPREGLIEAGRQHGFPQPACALRVPHHRRAVAEDHGGPRASRRVYEGLADEHARLAFRLQATRVGRKAPRQLLRRIVVRMPENRRRTGGSAVSAPHGSAVVPGPYAHFKVFNAVDEVAHRSCKKSRRPVGPQR